MYFFGLKYRKSNTLLKDIITYAFFNYYSMLKNNPTPTQEEIEKEFDGNICRCTGFRPILDAMKFFASDADPKLLRIAEKDIEVAVMKIYHFIIEINYISILLGY